MRALGAGLAAVLITGCGMDPGGDREAREYAALAAQVGSSAAAYGAGAAAAPDPAACHTAHAGYGDRVRPLVDRMRLMSGSMDDHMRRMGGETYADLRCGADAMTSELDLHDVAACASTVMAANHGEAARHATSMVTWAGHQRARAEAMADGRVRSGGTGGGGMGGGGMMDPSWAATMTCHRGVDGTFTLAP